MVAITSWLLVVIGRNFGPPADDDPPYWFLALILGPFLLALPYGSIICLCHALGVVLLKFDGTPVTPDETRRLVSVWYDTEANIMMFDVEFSYDYGGRKYRISHPYKKSQVGSSLHDVVMLRLYPSHPQLCMPEEALTVSEVIGMLGVSVCFAILSECAVAICATGISVVHSPWLRMTIVAMAGLLSLAVLVCMRDRLGSPSENRRNEAVAKIVFCDCSDQRIENAVDRRLRSMPSDDDSVIGS